MPEDYNEQISAEMPAAQESEISITSEKPRKNKSKFIILIAVIAIAVVAAIALGIFLPKGEAKEPRILFLKDDSFFASTAGNFTENFFVSDYDDAEDDDKFGFLNSVVTLGYSEAFDDVIYYCSDFEDGKCKIMRKDISADKPAEEIESDVSLAFVANSDGTALVYAKNRNLIYNIIGTKKVKIDIDVVSWCVNDEFTEILYTAEDGEGTFSLYRAFLAEKPDSQKIVSGISKVHMVSDDLGTVYYVKNGNLYCNVNGKEGKKIVADVESVYFSDSETFYFTKKNENKVLKSDYFEDDYREADSGITEPKESDYQYYYYGYYFTDEEYYYEALEEYRIKQNRDKVRAMAKEEFDSESVYYYDGSKEVLVCDDVFEFTVNEKGHLVFTAYDSSKIEKVKMSDLEYISEFEPYITNARKSTLVTHYAHNGKLVDVGYERPVGFCADAASDKMYFIGDLKTDKNKVDFGALNCVTFNESGETVINKLYDDVYSVAFISADGVPVYFKNIDKNNCADLYEGEKLLASGVKADSVKTVDGKYYFIKDYNSEDCAGVLAAGTSEGIEDIAEGVYNFSVENNGIVYSTDYEQRSDVFDLYWYNGTETKEIKKEVSQYTVSAVSIMKTASKIEVFNYYSCLAEYHSKLWEDSLAESDSDEAFDSESQLGLRGDTNAA